MTGRVCPKHEEWCPTGECRWCAPDAAKEPFGAVAARFAGLRIETAQCLMDIGMLSHYPSCPLKGLMAADPAKDLAAGCTCIPAP